MTIQQREGTAAGSALLDPRLSVTKASWVKTGNTSAACSLVSSRCTLSPHASPSGLPSIVVSRQKEKKCTCALDPTYVRTLHTVYCTVWWPRSAPTDHGRRHPTSARALLGRRRAALLPLSFRRRADFFPTMVRRRPDLFPRSGRLRSDNGPLSDRLASDLGPP